MNFPFKVLSRFSCYLILICYISVNTLENQKYNLVLSQAISKFKSSPSQYWCILGMVDCYWWFQYVSKTLGILSKKVKTKMF